MTLMNDANTTNVSDEQDFFLFSGRVLVIFYCLIFIFGLIGNSTVVYVAVRKKNYRNVTNCYVINLAIADLLFLTLSIPYTTYLAVKNSYPFGNTICQIYTYLAYGVLQATCNILAVMSIDRFLYIVAPKSRMGWRTSQNTIIICILIWIFSLILIIPYHIVSRVLTPGYTACGMNEHQNLIVCFFPFCSYYAIPLLVIIVCYTNLALHVIRTGRKMVGYVNTKSFHHTVQLKQRRVTRMVIVVTLAFAVCWLPIHILELIKCGNVAFLNDLIELHPKLLYSIRAFTHALAYFNSCLNPYLYAILNRNFCSDLVDIVPSWMLCCKKIEITQNEHFSIAMKSSIARGSPKNSLLVRNDHDEYESDCQEPKLSTNNASCQVELLKVKVRKIQTK